MGDVSMSTVAVIVTCALSSSVVAAIVTSIKEVVLWKFNRKAKLDDDKVEKAEEDKDTNALLNKLGKRLKTIEEKIVSLEELLEHIKESDRLLMQDKIKTLILQYIEIGEVTYDERAFIHKMWNSYHYGLDGNGDLDDLMTIFDELPIKV